MGHSGKRVMTFFFRSLVLWEEFLGHYEIGVVYNVLLRACVLILNNNQNGDVLGVCFFTSRNELQSAFEKADNGPPPKAKYGFVFLQ